MSERRGDPNGAVSRPLGGGDAAIRAVAVALGLIGLPRVASADRVKVAVVPGIAVNLDAARFDALSLDLADALRTELDVDAVGGLEVRRRLPPEGLPADCVATDACVTDVATRLGAQQLLFVVMVDTGAGGAIQVDSMWVDPKAHKTASRPAIDIASITDARSQFASAAHELLPDAPVRPKPQTGNLGRMSVPIQRHLELPAYLTAGATAVGLGVGLSFGLSARSKYDACDNLARAGTACSTSRKDSIRNVALLADAGWLIAIGGAIATTVLYTTSGETSHLIVEPGPGAVAVAAVGRF